MKVLEGQLSFEEILKEQKYLDNLNILQNMQPNEIKIFNVLDSEIKLIARSKDEHEYIFSKNRYGISTNVYSLAALLIIGFNHSSAKCKYINGNHVPWEIIE